MDADGHGCKRLLTAGRHSGRGWTVTLALTLGLREPRLQGGPPAPGLPATERRKEFRLGEDEEHLGCPDVHPTADTLSLGHGSAPRGHLPTTDAGRLPKGARALPRHATPR